MKIILLSIFLLIVCELFCQVDMNQIHVFAENEKEFVFRLGDQMSEVLENGRKYTKFGNFMKRPDKPLPLSCSVIKFYHKPDNNSVIRVLYYSHNKNINTNNSFVTMSHCAFDEGEQITTEFSRREECTDIRVKYGEIALVSDGKIEILFNNMGCDSNGNARK